MTLRENIEPLLEDFRRANAKGNMAIANIAMTRIVETLVDQLEMEQHLSLIASHWANRVDDTPPDLLGGLDEPQPLAEQPDPKAALLQAVHALHEANYVIGTDYAAIVEHLKNNPPEELPIKVRNKPGRKTNAERQIVKKAHQG